MPNTPKKKERKKFSPDVTMGSEKQKVIRDEAVEELSSEQIEEIFNRARQTVKPIINRVAEHEVVSEEILNFKMDQR